MIGAALVYEGCTVEVPFHARPFSQGNLTATDLTGDYGATHGHISLPPNC